MKNPSRKPVQLILVLAALVVVLAILHLSLGATNVIGPAQVIAELLRGPGHQDGANITVWELRLPRLIAGLLVGIILGSTASVYQSLFRNPLAEPYLLGVSGGAGVGGAIALVLGFGMALGGLGIVFGACIGALLSLVAVLYIAKHRRTGWTGRLLIGGIVIGAMLSSLMTVILVMSGGNSTTILSWLLGSLTPMFWPRVAVLVIAAVIALAVYLPLAQSLNLIAVSEQSAKQLGVDTKHVFRISLIVGTLASAVTVGTCGLISFLGLISPNIARRLVGVDQRRVLPASALLGAAFLISSDLFAQRLVKSLEVPVGAVTAVLGALTMLLLIPKLKV